MIAVYMLHEGNGEHEKSCDERLVVSTGEPTVDPLGFSVARSVTYPILCRWAILMAYDGVLELKRLVALPDRLIASSQSYSSS